MQWDQTKSTLSLNPVDLAVMCQSKIDISEIADQTARNHMPFWSILSYLLHSSHAGTAPRFWEYYRETLLLAKEREQHYSTVYLSKSNGKKRILHVPDWELSYQQRFILDEVLTKLPVSSCAYAYRKGISMADCAKPHVQQKTLIHLDIQNFFGSITESMVFHRLEQETVYSKQLLNFFARIGCYKGYLPQGACTSPVLSNICFRDCDDAIQAYAESHGLAYTRYSDDIYLSGDIADAGLVIRTVSDILQEHGFVLNREKTKVLHRNMSQRVLGLIVNDILQVSRSYRRALRQELYYLKKYGTDTEGVKSAPSYLHYLHGLQGKIAYVLSVDPFSEEFQRAKAEICNLIGTTEVEYYRNWLKQGNYGTFKEWKWRIHHPSLHPNEE